MIDGLKPYAARRDSGLPWLGELPAHWPALRLKTLVSNVVHQAERVLPDDYYIALEHVESWTGRIKESSAAAVEGQVKRFRAGDLLFGKLRPYLAKVARPSRPGVCVGEFLVLRPTVAEISGAYLEYLLRSAPFIAVVNSSTFGAKMPRAEWTFVGSLRVPYPPLDEQAAIVRFLDHADRRIRQYIRAKRRLIALLNEQKQAIVDEVVTRGLDRHAPLKPSGMRWIPQVPAHWSTMPAKALYSEVNERSESGAEELLSVSHITGVTSRRVKNVTMFLPESFVGYKICRPGDLVINTMWAWMAALGVSREHGIVSPGYAVYRPKQGAQLAPDYADLLFRTRPYASEYMCRSTGIRGSRLRLYPEQFLRIGVLLPPPHDQGAIVSELRRRTRTAEQAISRAAEEIRLVDEYRARLIADLVTGKLDVREAARQLPDKPEEADVPESRIEAAEEVEDADELMAEEAEA